MTRHGLAPPHAAALALRPTLMLVPDAADGDSMTYPGDHDRRVNPLIPRQCHHSADRQARSGNDPVSPSINQNTKSP